MKNLDEVVLEKKVVFLRADFNVPLDENRKVADDTRLKATIPTIEKIANSGAKLVIASHLGRPKGEKRPEFSLEPVCEHLSKLLNGPVSFIPDCIGEERDKRISEAGFGTIFLLENVRFYNEETKNDPDFARKLANGIDVFVNDAFAVSHRAHASVHAITKFVEECAAGYQLMKELKYYERALLKPARPVTFVIGGAKVSTKIGVLEHLVDKCDRMIIGGAMANTFFKALGKAVGKSLVEEDYVNVARDFMKVAGEKGTEIVLPIDALCAPSPDEVEKVVEVPIGEIPDNMMILDIGTKSVDLFGKTIAESKTIVWNGPVGMFEKKPFEKGTVRLAEIIANSSGLKVAGGGDTVAALKKSNVYDRFDYVSTGGGAFLELLEGKVLPGVAALEECGKTER